MKFGDLIQYGVKYLFFMKNYADNEKGKLVPDLFLLLKKAL